jgi:hypothetical protein
MPSLFSGKKNFFRGVLAKSTLCTPMFMSKKSTRGGSQNFLLLLPMYQARLDLCLWKKLLNTTA